MLSKKAKSYLKAALVARDDSSVKILMALDAAENNEMVVEDLGAVMPLSLDALESRVNLLEKSGYVETSEKNVTGRSLHPVCSLTSDGKNFLKLLKK